MSISFQPYPSCPPGYEPDFARAWNCGDLACSFPSADEPLAGTPYRSSAQMAALEHRASAGVTLGPSCPGNAEKCRARRARKTARRLANLRALGLVVEAARLEQTVQRNRIAGSLSAAKRRAA